MPVCRSFGREEEGGDQAAGALDLSAKPTVRATKAPWAPRIRCARATAAHNRAAAMLSPIFRIVGNAVVIHLR